MPAINLLLEDYAALLRIGVHARERAAPQRVRISVSAELRTAPRSDDIAETYDYTQMIAAVDALAAGHIDLLETFAAKLADQLLRDARLAAVEITLMKLDILDNGRVGVRYQKSKPL